MEMEGIWQNVGDPSNNYRYNGKELLPETGLYAYGFRYYDPTIGRFTGVDPISDQFPHVSTYNYAENEPIANIDLHGLQKLSFHFLGQLQNGGNTAVPVRASVNFDIGNRGTASGGVSIAGVPIGISGNQEAGYGLSANPQTNLPRNSLRTSFDDGVTEIFSQGALRVPNITMGPDFLNSSSYVSDAAAAIRDASDGDSALELLANTLDDLAGKIASGDVKVYLLDIAGDDEEVDNGDGTTTTRTFGFSFRLKPEEESRYNLTEQLILSGRLLIDFTQETTEENED
jgi:RHS repeat-associated protein